MNPVEPEQTRKPTLELNLKRDWPAAYKTVFQTMAATPIISALFVLMTLLDDALPSITLGFLWTFILGLVITRNVITNTYKMAIPESKAYPQFFQTKCLARMFAMHFLWILGSVFCSLFLIAPGIYLALALALCQQFIVLDNEIGSDAIKNSWNLTKGNKGKIFDYVVLGPLTLFAVMRGTSYFSTDLVAMLMPYLDAANSDKITEVIISVNSLIIDLIMMSAQVLAVRIWIDLMHKSGRTTAIEKKIAQQLASSTK